MTTWYELAKMDDPAVRADGFWESAVDKVAAVAAVKFILMTYNTNRIMRLDFLIEILKIVRMKRPLAVADFSEEHVEFVWTYLVDNQLLKPAKGR